MIVTESRFNENIETYTSQLKNLLAAHPVKYSSWPQQTDNTLSNSAGIYHFYEQEGESVASLYVGKAGFGNSNWNLKKRLNQHFLVSQKNTLIGKIVKATGQTPEQIKNSLSEREVYVQWLVLATNPATVRQNHESELVWFECFCKSVLKPKYTNA